MTVVPTKSLPTLLTILSILSLGACSMETVSSNDVKPTAVYRSYSLRYDESNNEVYSHADFTVGGPSGTHLDLDSPANVQVNAQDMKLNTQFGAQYHLSEKPTAPFGTTGILTRVFRYINADGVGSLQTLSIRKLTLASAPREINLKTPYVLHYSISANPEAKSFVEMTISQDYVSETVPTVTLSKRVAAANAGTLSFLPAEFLAAKLRPDQHATLNLSLSNSRETKDSAARLKIWISTEYKIKALKLTVH